MQNRNISLFRQAAIPALVALTLGHVPANAQVRPGSLPTAQEKGPSQVVSTNPLALNSQATNPPPQNTSQRAELSGTQIRWRANLSQARAEASQSGKPILLHFYKDDCNYCERLEKGAYRDPLVLEAIEMNCVPVKVFAPDNKDAAEKLGVDRFPTDVFVTADNGLILLRKVSPLDPYAYVSMLKTVHEEYWGLVQQQAAVTAKENQVQSGAPITAPAASAVQQMPAAEQSERPNFPQQPPQPVYQPIAETPAQLQRRNSAGLESDDQRGMLLASTPQNMGLPKPQMQSRTEPGGGAIQSPAKANINSDVNSHMGHTYSSSPTSEIRQPIVGTDESIHATQTRSTEARIESTEPMMEGYCMVTLVDDFQWELGKPSVGAMHLGHLYLFVSPAAREKFLAAPHRYAPVMNGLDVVKFFDEGQIVEGIRAKGCTTANPDRLFFFSSEESLAKFESSEQARAFYTQRAIELTERAAADANNRGR